MKLNTESSLYLSLYLFKVCNNKGNCHCDPGFRPPYCNRPGSGGSVDSATPLTRRQLKHRERQRNHEEYEKLVKINLRAVKRMHRLKKRKKSRKLAAQRSRETEIGEDGSFLKEN